MKEIRFVDVGEGITEGHVQKWLVKDGDAVKEDQPVVQVETDKAVVNAPSPISGKIKIAVPEDTIVHVGDTLAYIGEASELSAIPSKASPKQQSVQTAQPNSHSNEAQSAHSPSNSIGKEILATPNVRKLAKDKNIDISKIKGSGPGGRILEQDLLNYTSVKAPQMQTQAQTQQNYTEPKYSGDTERIPMSQTRKAIANNVEMSLSVPTFTHMDIIDATHLYNIVKAEKPNLEKLGVKLTFLPFIIKATVAALKENPRSNSSYDRDNREIILKKYYNIGLAAEAPDGLKVVVIKNADKKSIIEIAKEIQELHEKINTQKITIEEMRDSTFTITNIGSLGGGFLSVPIINSPNVGILGVHMIRDSPVVSDGQIKVGKILPFSLVFDHRVIDGYEAVLFGNALIKYLQDPDFLEILG